MCINFLPFQDEETQSILNNDFEVGNLIKDRIIPHAVLFFTGENLIDDDVSFLFLQVKINIPIFKYIILCYLIYSIGWCKFFLGI